ncbi:MAG: 23S rRNA (adenine(1618)-N(6))-methyltransferase RlmF [Bacteroidota bacterium]
MVSEKSNFHPKNKHRFSYNFKELCQSFPALIPFISINKFGNESIDFANPQAVKTLNKALLHYFYGIKNWDIPENQLCPPIPGRVDYLHYLADELSLLNNGKLPQGNKIKLLDIGTGANCIYPLLGNKEYDWNFVAADSDLKSLESAKKNSKEINKKEERIVLRLQKNTNHIFKDIIQQDEKFDFTLCNPPFHDSLEAARKGTERKWKNLGKTIETLNFGGQNNELFCEGGEALFVKKMIDESVLFSKNCLWFSTLVSKKSNLPFIYKNLKKVNAFEVKTIEMLHGQKTTRIVLWTFLNCDEQKKWVKTRWL